jgi:hypothetical protein
VVAENPSNPLVRPFRNPPAETDEVPLGAPRETLSAAVQASCTAAAAAPRSGGQGFGADFLGHVLVIYGELLGLLADNHA